MSLLKHRKIIAFLSAISLFLALFWVGGVFYYKKIIEEMLTTFALKNTPVQFEKIKIHSFFPKPTYKIKGLTLPSIPFTEKHSFSLTTQDVFFSFLPFLSKTITGHSENLILDDPSTQTKILIGPSTFNIALSQNDFKIKAKDVQIEYHKQGIHLHDITLSGAPETLTINHDSGPYEISGIKIEGGFKSLSFNSISPQSPEKSTDIENFLFSTFLMEKLDLSHLGHASLKEIFTEWRLQGGALDINEASLLWGDLSVYLNGTVALDESMTPEGAFTLTLKGIPAFLKALATHTTFPPEDRLILELSLGFLAGTSGEITLPLTLQNQALRVGSVLKLKVPPLF